MKRREFITLLGGAAVNAPTVNAPKPATARSDMAAYMRKRRAALKALRGK